MGFSRVQVTHSHGINTFFYRTTEKHIYLVALSVFFYIDLF